MAVVLLSEFSTLSSAGVLPGTPTFLIGYTNVEANGEQKIAFDNIVQSLTTSLYWSADILPEHFHTANDIISGVLQPSMVPSLDASKLSSGVLDAARIPVIGDAKLSGTVSVSKLPFIPTTLLTGTIPLSAFALSSIPSTALLDIQNDPRLSSNLLAKTGPAQNVFGPVNFKNVIDVSKRYTVLPIEWTNNPYSVIFDGMIASNMHVGHNPNTDVFFINGGAKLQINYPIRNEVTESNPSNTAQLNAEGYRYIGTSAPSNTFGSNGDTFYVY